MFGKVCHFPDGRRGVRVMVTQGKLLKVIFDLRLLQQVEHPESISSRPGSFGGGFSVSATMLSKLRLSVWASKNGIQALVLAVWSLYWRIG